MNNLLSMSDIFLLPSLHEGYPVSLVEAQVSGIKSFVSNTITREVKLTESINYLPLDSIDLWVNEVAKSSIGTETRQLNEVSNRNIDIQDQALKYQCLLHELGSI